MAQAKQATTKPTIKLSNSSFDSFTVATRVAQQLKRAGADDEAKEFLVAALAADSFGDVLVLALERADIK